MSGRQKYAAYLNGKGAAEDTARQLIVHLRTGLARKLNLTPNQLDVGQPIFLDPANRSDPYLPVSVVSSVDTHKVERAISDLIAGRHVSGYGSVRA